MYVSCIVIVQSEFTLNTLALEFNYNFFPIIMTNYKYTRIKKMSVVYSNVYISAYCATNLCRHFTGWFETGLFLQLSLNNFCLD